MSNYANTDAMLIHELRERAEKAEADLAEALELLRTMEDESLTYSTVEWCSTVKWWQQRDAFIAKHAKEASDGR